MRLFHCYWGTLLIVLLAAGLLCAHASPCLSATTGSTLPGDLNGDGVVSAGELQQSINAFLGLVPATGSALPGDLNGDGVVSIGELQQGLNAFLGVVPAARQARVTFATSGTLPQGTEISAMQFTVRLPAGVTVAAAADGAVAADAIGVSGLAPPSFVVAKYVPASGTTAATITVGAMNTSQFPVGEFLTLICKVSGGISPTASDFAFPAADAYDQNENTLSSITIQIGTVTLQ